MIVDIRIRGQLPADLIRAEILHAVRAHVQRFAAEVVAVHVRVTDMNGPRHGLDMHASVSVQGPRIGAVIVEELGASPTLAAASALERLESAVQRDLDRLRTLRRARAPASLRAAAVY